MKIKKIIFDVELIIDHEEIKNRFGEYISTHRVFRGLSLKELEILIRKNEGPEEISNTKITFNIRGVNY